MCTLTWVADPDGFQVFFNRDEQRTRKPAHPPELMECHGVRFLAPRDGESGGTWIAASESGLCLCVLNGFAEGGTPERKTGGEPAYETRGLLPYELMGAATAGEATSRLGTLALHRFRPFLFAAFDPPGGASLARWSGSSLSVEANAPRPEEPLVSSSYSPEEVQRSRRVTFERLRHELAAVSPTERHLVFHRSHEPERGPRAPCMHRPDARTVSFTRVEVGPERVRMHYVPHAPCRGLVGPSVELPRRTTAGGSG